MKRYYGGDKVQRGAYFAYPSLEFHSISQNGGSLPALKGWYVNLPGPLMLVAGPLLGLAFIIFLPLIGIVAVAAYIGKHLLLPALRTGARAVGEAVLVPVQIGYARFTGRARPARKSQPKSEEDVPTWQQEIEEITRGKK